ncbi:hypothetical protein [uncultured Winogradskyella sp.]|uniref:hypothetical protein n=1 Tax=uncultured Winogradskyella sp. TaxID=395353 RepID=UPI002611E255|nr:hypothetical protein [uncultured Winogradskyella sp.]
MKKQYSLILLLCLCFIVSGYGQTTIIDFETVNDGYTPSTNIPGPNGWEDIFDRTNHNMTIITNEDGYYWAIEDINGSPFIDIDQIDITGATEFEFSIDWIAHHFNDWDADSEFSITYSIDGGTYQNLIWVRNVSGATNAPAAIDTDFDGTGECGPTTTLPSRSTGTSSGCTVDASRNQFETYTTTPIALTSNSTLDIRLSFVNLNNGDEGLYLDNITIDLTIPSCTPAHSLTSFAPTEGPIGTVVTITGDDFSNSTSVDFNGTASTNIIYLDTDADGTIDTLLAEVPTGATTGNITITEAGCPLTSASPFTVLDTSVSGCNSTNLSDLIITELYDRNGGTLGYIEIYNGTGSAVNLSNYSVRRYGSIADVGATPDNYTLYTFPASTSTINNNTVIFGEVFSPGNTDSDTTPDFTYDVDCSFTSGPPNPSCGGFNSDDVFELYNGTTLVDIYHVPNRDDTNALISAGYYARRDPNTAGPNTMSNPSDWSQLNQNDNGSPATDDLGVFVYTGSTTTYPSATAPSDVIGSCLTSASFTSNGTASAGGAITYQWYFNDGTSTSWTIVNATNLPLTSVTGATNSTLTLTDGLYNYDNYQFYCEVTENGTCSAISNAAQLRIGTATWNGTNWIWNNGTAIDTAPSLASNVVLDDDFNTSIGGLQQSFSACNLTLNDNVSLFIDDDDYVEVQNDLVVNNITTGGINIEPRGSFVQINDNGLVSADEPENLTVNKVTAPANNWYEYTYWSSPVANEIIGDALLPSNVNRRYWFNAQNYLDEYAEVGNNNATGAGNEGQDDIDDDNNDWQQITGSSTISTSSFLEPGIGYASTHDPAAFNCTPGPGCPDPRPGVRYTFSGLFNNGIVEPNIYRNDIERSDNNWNLIGNPYPSAIDVDQFFAVNFYSTTNPNGSSSGTIEGVVYMWSHNSPPDATNNGNQNLNFLASDYVVINGLGTVTPTEEQGTGETLPNRFIPSGQAFFVAMSDNGGPAYNMSSPSTETDQIVFNNAMRVRTNNDQFFRNASQPNPDNKLWVNLTSDNGVFSQILVGYTDGATNNFDGSYYDAYRNLSNDSYSGLYSLIDNNEKQFAIQGRNPNSLTLDEVIPLGFFTAIEDPTIYTLSIPQVEGDFMNSNTIYLIDRLDNSIHQLSTSDYSFVSETGEFNERFEIVFTPEALSIDDNIIDSNALTIIELTNGDVKFKVGSQFTINQVEILDLQGRQIYVLQGNSSTEVFNLSQLSSAPYVAKVTLSNGRVISKKAIKQ